MIIVRAEAEWRSFWRRHRGIGLNRLNPYPSELFLGEIKIEAPDLSQVLVFTCALPIIFDSSSLSLQWANAASAVITRLK